jgi:hypothetical protein
MLKIKKLFNQWLNYSNDSAEEKLVELLDKYTVTNPYFVYDSTNKRRIFLFVKDGSIGKYFNFATVEDNDNTIKISLQSDQEAIKPYIEAGIYENFDGTYLWLKDGMRFEIDASTKNFRYIVQTKDGFQIWHHIRNEKHLVDTITNKFVEVTKFYRRIIENDKIVETFCWGVQSHIALLHSLKFLDDKGLDYFYFIYNRKQLLDEVFSLDSKNNCSVKESLNTIEKHLNEMKLLI